MARRYPTRTRKQTPARVGLQSSDRGSGSNGRARRVQTEGLKTWRKISRPRLLRSAVRLTNSLPWTQRLLEALLDELYADQAVEELLATPPGRLPKRRYPQAVALALVVRHSWHPDDLAFTANRLGLSVTRTITQRGK